MDDKEEITKIKKKINDKLKNKELTEIIVGLICFLYLVAYVVILDILFV